MTKSKKTSKTRQKFDFRMEPKITRTGLSYREKILPAATNSNSPSYVSETILPNCAILPNRARLQTDGWTDERTGWFQYTPLTSLRGGGLYNKASFHMLLITAMYTVRWCSLQVWRISPLEKGPLVNLFLHHPGAAPGWSVPKSLYTGVGPWVLHLYQVSQKSI